MPDFGSGFGKNKWLLAIKDRGVATGSHLMIFE